MKFKGEFLFFDNSKVTTTVANPNKINFTSSDRFESIRFMNNSQDNGNDIDNCEESDLSVGFKGIIWNYLQNSKEISQRSS